MKKKLLGAAAVTIAALVLAGCSPAATPPEEVKQDLVVGIGNFPPTLDPHQFTGDGPLKHVFETLVVRDGEGYGPLLATSWDTPDDLTWVFNLDPDATFSDGTPLTATDVKASVERIVEIGGSLAPLWAGVTAFEATDDHTFTVRSSVPLGTMLGSMSMMLVGKADLLGDENYWNAPIGSGKFVVTDYVASERLAFAANEDYWADRASTLDSITFMSIPEQSSRITAIATGEIDIATEISSDALLEIEATEGVEVTITPSYTYHMLWFNHERAPFDNELVRKAMLHAVDVDSAVADLYGSLGQVAQGPIPQTVLGAPTLSPYAYDPDLAKQLLADAGYADGFSASVKWPEYMGEPLRSLLATFASQWGEVGITIESMPQERSIWTEDLNSLNWDMNSLSNTVLTGDPDYTLGRLYVCSANRLGYCNDEVDALLLQAKETVDQNERATLYQQAGEIMWDEALGLFPVELSEAVAHNPGVQNLVLAPNGRHDYSTVVLTQ